MPNRRKNELIPCVYYVWRLIRRAGVFWADGRSNATRSRHSLGTKSRPDALSELRRLDVEMAARNGLISRDAIRQQDHYELPLAEGWEMYLRSVIDRQVDQGRSKKTSQRYQAVWQKFGAYCAARNVSTCRGMSTDLVRGYLRQLAAEDYGYATRYLELTTLKQFGKFLITEGKLPESARIQVSMHKPEGTNTYCFTHREMRAILNYSKETSKTQWLYPIFVALAYTGMRISELASLRWSDVVLTKVETQEGSIRLTDERHRPTRSKSSEPRRLKSGRGRVLPINPELWPVLQELPKTSDGRVFHSAKGVKVKPDRVRLCLIRDVLTPLAGRFPKINDDDVSFIDGTVHSFRHYFCSLCAGRRDVSEHTLMSWLGHRSSKMVRHYFHLEDAAAQSTMAAIRIPYFDA